MKLKSDFLISTKGLRKLHKPELLRADGRFFANDPFHKKCRVVTFYRDEGQLHWPHGRGCETHRAYIVQCVDGEVYFQADTLGISSIEPYLDPNIKTDVIVCDVAVQEIRDYHDPVRGEATFLARRHPSSKVRQELLMMLHEYECKRLNQCEHVSQPAH